MWRSGSAADRCGPPHRYSMVTFLPSIEPHRPSLWKSGRYPRVSSLDVKWRNPITGIACCWRVRSKWPRRRRATEQLMTSRCFTRSPRRAGEQSAGTVRPIALAVEVDHQLELVGPQHRQVQGLFAFEDSTDIDASLAMRVRKAGAGKSSDRCTRTHALDSLQANGDALPTERAGRVES